jgi:hypothetical protein
MSQFNFEAEPFGEFTDEQAGAEELEQRVRVRDHRGVDRAPARVVPRARSAPRSWAPFVVGRAGRHVPGRAFFAGPAFGRGPRAFGGGFWRGLGLNRGYGYHRYRPRLPFGYPGVGWSYGGGFASGQTGSSEWILQLQASLATLVGDWVPQSGALDVETRRAIGMFQKQAQLPVTGAPDEATLSALEAATASASGEPSGAQEFEDERDEEGEARRSARPSDFLPDVFAQELGELEEEKLKDGLKRFRRDKSNLLSLQIPDAPYSATLITRVQKGLDIFAAVDIALEVFAEPIAVLIGARAAAFLGVGLGVTAPILALIGNFMALGAPYAEARAEHAKDRVRWGFALGAVLGAGARDWAYVKQRHWQRIPHPNPMDQEMGRIGQKAFNLGLVTGFVQGRKLNEQQRKFLFASTTAKFTRGDLTVFGVEADLTPSGWDDFYYRSAAIFLSIYAKD